MRNGKRGISSVTERRNKQRETKKEEKTMRKRGISRVT